MKQSKRSMAFILATILSVLLSCHKPDAPSISKILEVRPAMNSVIDGFGVNITPAQWNNGRLKPTLDLLTDDLGCTIVRLDAFGDGNWLHPDSLLPDGKWSNAYLTSVYTSKPFSDCWATAKYLQSKGVEIIFNVSGDVPAQWKEADNKTLKNFIAYAEMQATMVDHIRNHEKIKIRYYMPFNETDYGGNIEGPGIADPNKRITAFKAIVDVFKAHGHDDLQHILFCDGWIDKKNIEPFLKDSSFVSHVYAFSGHTYGDGGEGDANEWYSDGTRIASLMDQVKKSGYRKAKFVLSEYGDLDQTGEIEWEIAWRSNRRLMQALRDGTSSAMAWDAFDNYHVHDSTWAIYGLLATDTNTWRYTPKKRYYGAKHFYRFVKPGWSKAVIYNEFERKRTVNPYGEWKAANKNLNFQAFFSPDQLQYAIVGYSLIEKDVALTVNLGTEISGVVYVYATNENYNCKLIEKVSCTSGKLTCRLPYKTIVTISNIVL